jgi:hypothetical protein
MERRQTTWHQKLRYLSRAKSISTEDIIIYQTQMGSNTYQYSNTLFLCICVQLSYLLNICICIWHIWLKYINTQIKCLSQVIVSYIVRKLPKFISNWLSISQKHLIANDIFVLDFGKLKFNIFVFEWLYLTPSRLSNKHVQHYFHEQTVFVQF